MGVKHQEDTYISRHKNRQSQLINASIQPFSSTNIELNKNVKLNDNNIISATGKTVVVQLTRVCNFDHWYHIHMYYTFFKNNFNNFIEMSTRDLQGTRTHS